MTLREFTMKYASLKEGKELENYLSNIIVKLQIAPANKIKNIV